MNANDSTAEPVSGRVNVGGVVVGVVVDVGRPGTVTTVVGGPRGGVVTATTVVVGTSLDTGADGGVDVLEGGTVVGAVVVGTTHGATVSAYV
jgi:hypothetical protein